MGRKLEASDVDVELDDGTVVRARVQGPQAKRASIVDFDPEWGEHWWCSTCGIDADCPHKRVTHEMIRR
jgi:hypothetical protein